VQLHRSVRVVKCHLYQPEQKLELSPPSPLLCI
jgi:hypothetical protein